MKRSLLAAAALLLIGTASASAFDVTCGAPVVPIGDDTRDSNPVVNISISYVASEHQWRVFHYLRNGLVVSRTEQYAVLDATNERKTQWQGSLNRNRSLYMVGELKRDGDSGVVYMEWIYDRGKGNALVMQSTAHCAMAAPPQPQQEASMLFMIPRDVSSGYMNVRNGPGANHALLGAIPAGQTVRASRCVPRDDGIAGADWCLVNWNGLTGWVSQVGLMPVQAQPAPSSLPRPTAQAPWPSPDSVAAAPLQPTPVPTVPVVRVKDSVPIYPYAQGNAAKIDVLIGGQPLRMLLDTGATTCLITEAIAARLVSDGHAVWQENSRFKMADGTVRNMPMVLIHEMRIGSHILRNVPSGVSATDGIILAFPVVNGIAPFTIDTRVGELIFHTGKGEGDRL